MSTSDTHAAPPEPAPAGQAPSPEGAAPVAQPARGRRLAFLDGIRAVAALYVVFHHTWLTTFHTYPVVSGPKALGWLIYGQLGVAVFIVVSGFSLSLATVRADDRLVGGLRRFIRRRAWRILPAYWAALILSVLLVATLIHARTGETTSVRAVWVHATLLQDVFGSASPNGAFWSIAPEWQIYFVFPILLFLVRRLSALSATLITTAAVVGGYVLATHVHAFHKFLDLSPVFLALFAFGMLAARLTTGTSRWERVPWGIIAAVSAVAMLLVINLSGSRAVINQFFWVDLGVGFVVACAIASMTVGRSRWLRSILESRLIVFLGSFSFSIYLIHAPLLEVVWLYWVKPLNLSQTNSFGVLVLFGIPVILAGSYLFFLVCERPFLTHRSFASLFGRTKPAETRPSSSTS